MMGERVTNTSFCPNGGGWTISPQGSGDLWDCDFYDYGGGCYGAWNAWYYIIAFSVSQLVDLTNVDFVTLSFQYTLERNSGDDTYFRILIGGSVVFEGNVTEGEPVTQTIRVPVSSVGTKTIEFAGKGGENSYVGAYLWGCSAIGQDVPPAPVANFTGSPLTGEAPLSVSFTDTSTGSPTSWLWSFGDGNLSTLQNPVHTYETPGSYDVNLKASNDGGFGTEQKDDYIVVNIPPKRAALLWAYRFGPS